MSRNEAATSQPSDDGHQARALEECGDQANSELLRRIERGRGRRRALEQRPDARSRLHIRSVCHRTVHQVDRPFASAFRKSADDPFRCDGGGIREVLLGRRGANVPDDTGKDHTEATRTYMISADGP